MKNEKLGFFSLGIIFLLGLVFLYLHFSYPTASPLVSGQYKLSDLGKPHAKMEKEVIGFLPYWRLDDSKYIKHEYLSELIFFSLTSGEDGNIIKVNKGETDPGYRWWKSEIIKNLIAKQQIAGGKFGVTIAMQKNEILKKFLDNSSAQQTLINNLLSLISENKINGLNLDFEYDGTPDDKYREKFLSFAKNLTKTFRERSPETELSIDLFPLSVRKPRLFDVQALAPLFDKVVVMSYDYYAGSSDLAGPGAPIDGYIASPSAKEKNYIFDITTTYSDYISLVPKDKLIMGVPYYGWDYPVSDNSTPLASVLAQNDTNGYAEVISYGRAKTDKDINPKDCQWDEVAKQAWCGYTNSEGIKREVWVEDNKSIGVKFDFAKSKNLGGIAIWTLGYDKDYPDLWNMIKSKFTQK